MDKDPYGKSASRYDKLIEPLNAGLRVIGLKIWPPEPGMSVLDVGCGTGSHLKLYQEAGCQVFGIDISPSMLEMARRKIGGDANLQRGDGSRMPYRNGIFDLIILSMAIHEVSSETRSAILNESRRVLKNDGRILVIDYHPGPIQFPKGWQHKVLVTFIEFVAGLEHFRNYRNFLGRGGFPSLANEHKLYVEKEKIVSGGNLGVFLARLG